MKSGTRYQDKALQKRSVKISMMPDDAIGDVKNNG